MFLKDILDTGAVTLEKLELKISNFCFRYYKALPATLGVTVISAVLQPLPKA